MFGSPNAVDPLVLAAPNVGLVALLVEAELNGLAVPFDVPNICTVFSVPNIEPPKFCVPEELGPGLLCVCDLKPEATVLVAPNFGIDAVLAGVLVEPKTEVEADVDTAGLLAIVEVPNSDHPVLLPNTPVVLLKLVTVDVL